LLQEMTERQIQAQVTWNKILGEAIAGGIQSSLKEPMERIGSMVQAATSDQSAQASQLLTDVMASFSQRLNELFGGQISGIQELNRQSAQSMQEAVSALNQLVGRLEEGSQRSAEAMSERVSTALEALQQHQKD